MTVGVDKNDLAFWYPPVAKCVEDIARPDRLRVPKTKIVRADGIDLEELLDGSTPADFWPFIGDLMFAASDIGLPCFLRTGHGSGKHEWSETCYLDSAASEVVARHVCRLVEWSNLVDMFGLPTDTWAVRELIPTSPLFRCRAYGGMPFVPEWRIFVRDDTVEHEQPYWPLQALEQGEPDSPVWRTLTEPYQDLRLNAALLRSAAIRAVEALGGGFWSVDFLWSQPTHAWWLIDMADGERSFRYDP